MSMVDDEIRHWHVLPPLTAVQNIDTNINKCLNIAVLTGFIVLMKDRYLRAGSYDAVIAV